MNCFKFGAEPEKKCVISVVDMWYKQKRADDKVNLYIYDKEKYASKMWREDREHTVEDVEPIGSINYCHEGASYITYGSLLFRIGGRYLTYREKDEHMKIALTDPPPDIDRPANQGWPGGRLNSYSMTVDIIELKDDLMVATKGPEMKFPRFEPHLLILQGNLYVAGGFSGYHKDEKDVVFMEVLRKSAADWFWEAVDNPPPLCKSSDDEVSCYDFLTGAVESIGVIIVGFIIVGLGLGRYKFYTYQPRTTTWEYSATYTDMTIVRQPVDSLVMRPAVVSGKFMLWLPNSNSCTLLYVMDLKNNKLIIIDLLEKKLLPRNASPISAILSKLKEGEFCVFWVDVDGPQYSSGTHTYTGFHASTFTLKTRIGKKKGTLGVKLKKRYFSLIPECWRTYRLEEVCIADVPDSKQQRWTPFC